MNYLSIDIETYSSINLAKSGVYRYCEAEDFEILLFGYSVDGGEVKVVDFARGAKIPKNIIRAISDDGIIKWAFNATFERICLSRHLGLPTGTYLDPSSWRCTMIWSAYLGLPLSLMGVGAVLGLQRQKLSEGKDLIRYFCTPCNPTITNGGRTRNEADDAPDKWRLFIEYNKRDVEVEIAIHQRLCRFPVPDAIWDEYRLDQGINDRGVLVDKNLVGNAIKMDKRAREELIARMKELTDLENPNSVSQVKTWLSENGLEVDSLGKKDVKAALQDAPRQIQEVLELRLQLAKSSVKKYQAMENAVCSDGRTRGMFQFYGANRTGRWAGRLVQMQNLPQNHLVDLETARTLVNSGGYEAVQMLYSDVPNTLSQLVRTAFIPRNGYRFIVSDFSAIEARVLSWLAGETWRMEVFAGNGDIYCASASQMFKVPVEKHGQNAHLRQKGKIAELALGYGGSVGALKAMGALDMGLEENELKPLVDVWRQSNPNIVQLWWDVDKVVKEAVKERMSTNTHGIRFSYESGFLFITLPSGRRLAYVKPRMGTNDFGSDCVTYEGVGATKKWERIETYGPKVVENIVQAISRDILCYSMQQLKDHRICMHIHDEIVIEAPDEVELKDIEASMAASPSWAEGLLLNADGFETKFYKKD
ncbi:DNA polymerase [Sphaerochaeta sp. UBA5849]|jgi:DNA polymerase|uniref:DNA polymerase n=1 Tax=Sphaerochaeta sp. UBA5849 TaxID=1947475 RepID=UPI0031F55F6C